MILRLVTGVALMACAFSSCFKKSDQKTAWSCTGCGCHENSGCGCSPENGCKCSPQNGASCSDAKRCDCSL